MKRAPTVIDRPSQLSGLTVFRTLRPPAAGRIVIEDAGVPAETRRAWEGRLNRRYFACGCSASALGLLLGGAGYAVWMAVRPGSLGATTLDDLWRGLGLVVAGAVVGKVAGLLRAQRRLDRVVGEIRAEWKKEEPREEAWFRCG